LGNQGSRHDFVALNKCLLLLISASWFPITHSFCALACMRRICLHVFIVIVTLRILTYDISKTGGSGLPAGSRILLLDFLFISSHQYLSKRKI
jgi:hypothetical protein